MISSNQGHLEGGSQTARSPLNYISIMRTIIMFEETMDNRSQSLWCARQGWVVILSLGLTGVACGLLGWAQDVRQASPGRTASEDASTFVFKELAVTATKTPRDPLTTPGEGNVISRDDIERTQAHTWRTYC